MILLALYAVQVFSDHKSCTTRSGFEVTKSFEFAFQIGLIVLAVDGLNTNVVNIFLRFKVISQRDKIEPKETWTYTFLAFSNGFEWFLRFGILVVSLVQFLTNH